MGKLLANKIRGINPLAKKGVFLFGAFLLSFACILGVKDANAAPVRSVAWTRVINDATTRGTGTAVNLSGNFTVPAGSGRILLVAITQHNTQNTAPAAPTTISYGGVTLTLATTNRTTSARVHSWLYYLKDNAVMDGTARPLALGWSAGIASRKIDAFAAVYTGVDQQFVSLTTGSNISNTSSTAAMSLSAAMAVAANSEAVYLINNIVASTTNGTAAATWTANTNWTTPAAPNATTDFSVASNGTYYPHHVQLAERVVPATATTDNAVTGTKTSSRYAMSALVLPPAGVNVTNGSAPANVTVHAGDTNIVADAFAMAGTGTVNAIQVAGNANTTTTNISAIRIYRKVGGNLTAYEASDVLIGSGTFAANPATITLPAAETISSAANYIIVYDIAPTAMANGTSITFTGSVSALTPAATSLTDSGATITIYPATTLGNGVEPANARLWKASPATNLDAFTLKHNGTVTDDDTVSTVIVTLTPPYISGGSGSTVSKIKLIEVVRASDNAVMGSLDLPTTGDIWNIPTPTLTATSTETAYYIRISTADSIIPLASDASCVGSPTTCTGYYSPIQGKVTSVVHSKAINQLVLGDTASASLSIDVEKPIGPASLTATTPANAPPPGGGKINLTWPAAYDPSSGTLDATAPYLVVRSSAGSTDPPPYCTLRTTPPDVDVLLNVGNVTSFTDSGLNDRQAPIYHYRICAKDSLGNISIGTTAAVASSYSNYCAETQDVALGSEDPLNASLIQDQIIRTEGTMAGDTTPFLLQITNNDIGTCPNVTFNVALVDVTTTGGKGTGGVGDPLPSLADFNVIAPATVTLGKAMSKTSSTSQIKIYGLPTADQIQKFRFRVQVTPSTVDGHPTVLNTTSNGTQAYATGVLNDMPPIVHNANNMAKYQYGTWGNDYTCATCHSNSTTNIKGIYQVISTPIGRRNVVFSKHSGASTADWAGLYSNDTRPTKNVSNNVCSVCHHKTRQHQYSANKPFGGPVNDPYNAEHHNARDCVKCHTHNTAFRSILGQCGDCHGFKGTNYSPVSKATMVKQLTNALGTNPPSYGAHARHNTAKMSCAACHSNTNHGLNEPWIGDDKMEMGFSINNNTFPGFNPSAPQTGGMFEGSNNLNAPYVWTAAPGTTITLVGDFNASCSTYCHGGWSGNAGSNTKPNWVGAGQAACGTCHNATGTAPPVSGSHAKHAGTTGAGLAIACTKCHLINGSILNSYTGSAHINGDVAWDLSAYPGATYRGQNAGSTGTVAPSATYGSCTNLYCHSNIQGPTGTGNPTSYATPTWGGSTTCGSCHIYPNTTGSHSSHENAEVSFDCHVCHNNGGTTTPPNHGNGTINFQFVGLGQNTVYSAGANVAPGTAYGSCSNSDCHGRFTRKWGTPNSGLTMCDKCHGSVTSPRGFYSTRGPDGTLSIYSAAIGVHDIHIQNLNSPRKTSFRRYTSYANGFSCRQCHSVPSGPFTAGHIDTALPAEVPFSHISSIADKGNFAPFTYYSSPTYTRSGDTSGVCSNVWCHGAGMDSNRGKGEYVGTTPAINRTNPNWYGSYLTGNGLNDCTKCHAMPPPAKDATSMHYGVTLNQCTECHQHVGADGLSFKNKALHINGKIDGGCDICHGYPPTTPDISVNGARNTGLATPAQNALTAGFAGSHGVHIQLPAIGKVCTTCHNGYAKAMPSNELEIGFRAFGGLVTTGTFTGYSNAGSKPNWKSSSAGTTILRSTTQDAQCSNLYCHGGGTATLPPIGGGSNTNPSWVADAGTPSICGSCHGTDSLNAPAGGSHPRHANQVASLACSDCHGVTADNGTHVNATIVWKLNRSNPVIGASATYNNISSGSIAGLVPRNNGTDYRNCNNIYCHSNVQGTNGSGNPTVYASPKWGNNGTMTCGSCHKDAATDVTAPGSHKKHANTTTGTDMAISCGYCHQDAGFGYALHTDGAVYVNFTSYVGGSYSAGTPLATGMNKDAGSAAYGTCSATFCHGTKASPAWGTPGPLACTACHGASSDKTVSPGWSGRHTTHYNYSTAPTVYNDTLTDLSSNTKYRFNCKHCHDTDATKHSLKPYSSTAYARVFFGISGAGTSARRGKYVYDGAKTATDNGFKFTAGSCNTSYCHSNGQGGNPRVTFLNWTTRPVTGSNCLFCHDNRSITATATGLSGKHDKHMNPANNAMIGTGNGFNCTDCHAQTNNSTNNLSVTNKSNHVNGMVNFSGAKANKTYNAISKVCSNVYCHSNGNPNATVFVSMTGQKAWNGTSTFTTCNKCHGRSNTIGYPDYANGGGNTATSNLHPGHLAGMTDTTSCTDCHRKTPDTITANKFRPYSTLHMSGSPNINFNTAKTYIGTKANVVVAGTQVTCSGIVCHGQGAPVWGASKAGGGGAGVRSCTKCHGSNSSDYTVGYVNYTSAMIAPGYGADGTDTSLTKKAATDPRVGAHQKHLTANVISTNVKCGECHVSVTNMRSGNHWNYSTATLTFNGKATANSHTPTPSRTNGIMSCSNTYCHTGKSNSGTTIAPFWNMTGLVKEGTLTVASCQKCHGFPPKTVGAGGTALTYNHTSIADPVSFPVTGCACHNNMSNTGTTYANIFVDKSLHMNGTINALGGHSFGYAGYKHYSAAGKTPWASCTGCHTNGSNTTYPVARGTAPDCTSCHISGLKTPTASAPAQSCYDCHGSTASNGQPNGAYSAFPNWSGSHTNHIAKSYVCSDCHNNVGAGKAGHGNYSGIKKTRADVAIAFNTARTGTTITYASGTMSCSTSKCHGQKSPAWGSVIATQECRYCHGSQSVAYTGYTQATIAPGTGNFDTGRVTGNTVRGGVHQEHLTDSNGIGKKVRCSECHQTVAAVTDATHLNYTTATVTFSGNALAASHTATNSRVSGVMNCSNVYCHQGARAEGTAAGQTGFATRPALTWNNASLIDGTTVAGTCTNVCHQMPPGGGVANDAHSALLANGSYTTPASLSSCSSNTPATGCHPTINSAPTAMSNIFFNKLLHIDGKVDGGSCSSCHGYEVGTWASKPERSGVAEGKGAHEKHIAFLVAKWGGTLNPSGDQFGTGLSWTNVCGVCHNGATHSTGEAIPGTGRTISIQSTYQFGGSLPTYNGTVGQSSATKSKVCFNVSCHYFTSPVWSTY